MTKAATDTGEGPRDGQLRRRERTRAALLAAARALLAEGRQTASIEQITRRAGVGFGSFFNHFPEGKEELFSEAVLELLDRYAERISDVGRHSADPAEVVSAGVRITGRLALDRPEVLAPVLQRGTAILLVDRGMRPAAIRDLQVGIDCGRFTALPAEVHFMALGGIQLGLLQQIHADPDSVDEDTVDVQAAGALRMLGVPAEEAAALVRRELPSGIR